VLLFVVGWLVGWLDCWLVDRDVGLFTFERCYCCVTLDVVWTFGCRRWVGLNVVGWLVGWLV